MRSRCGLAAAAAAIVGGLVVVGCGSSPGPKASPAVSHDPGQAGVSVALFRSPEQATLSWCYVVNRKDEAVAVAHFGNPDGWWTVYLKRQPDGRWLITGYGQP